MDRELAKYEIDNLTLTGTRHANEGSICELEEGYPYFWKDRLHGVGIALCTTYLQHLPTFQTGSNEQLMNLRILIYRTQYVTIISAYVPTLRTVARTICSMRT